MKKETRNRIEKVLNYAKENNCSVKAACIAKNYNYSTLMNTIKYTRSIGKDEDIISLYDSVKKSTGNSVEHIDTDERAETEQIRNEDGTIVSYRFKVFRRDKTPVIGALTRDEMNLIYRLYSYYGSSLTQRQVSRHFPDYSLVDFKRILRAFNITKASSPFAPHVIEEHTPEELQEMQLREKENDFLKAVEKNEVRDLKQLVIKLTKEQMKSSISEEKLIQLIKETNKDYKELPVNINSNNPTYPILIIWLSDLHIGAYNAKYSSFVTLPNYDKEEIKSRLTKIVQTFVGQSYGAVYVVNLGDSIDGYNKETTRGGHQLPEVMDDKEISETYIECMMEFFKSLKTNVKSDEFNYLCIGESNHDGNWGWLNNKLLAAYLANEGIKSFISNFPIDHFTIGKHSWIFMHGKDNNNQSRQFPLTLNPQTELYFANYIAEQNISNKYIYVVKGDLHNYAYTTGKQFDYISVGSMYGSSNYIVANFGHTKWSINYSVVTEDDMLMGTVKGSNLMSIKSWKNRNYMLTRSDILSEAIHKCLVEMYKWAQPAINLDKLIADGYKDSKEDPLYKKHYLSEKNFIYLRDIYKDAYGITDNWNDTFELLIDYLVKGGTEDDYRPATKDRPAYRDYKKVPALNTLIGKEDTDKCLEHIKKCQNFYCGHSREVNQFDITMALGVGSPNSNAEYVTKYWQSHGRPDFSIKDFKIDDIIYDDRYPAVDEFLESLK